MLKDAQEDGIRYNNGQKYIDSFYYPLCCECGVEVPTWSYIRGRKYRCRDCKKVSSLKDRESKTIEEIETKERKFSNAVARVTKGECYDKYEVAINKVHNKLHKDKWFQSTEEIVAAIILVHNNIKVRHQVKFGRYTVDFVLPEAKVVLEIDGALYHNEKTVEKEKIRDSLIVLALGPTWEVIRIADVQLNENPKNLVKAIKAVQRNREKLRRLYNGRINNYSTHNT